MSLRILLSSIGCVAWTMPGVQSWDEGLFIANSLFAGIFTLEAIVKLVALYPKQYFRFALRPMQ